MQINKCSINNLASYLEKELVQHKYQYNNQPIQQIPTRNNTIKERES